MSNPSTWWREARRELRTYAALAAAGLGAGVLVAVLLLVWRLAGAKVEAAWLAVPLEMRLALQVSVLAVGVGIALLTAARAWQAYRGRALARSRARETPPIVEFSAGSVTAATLTRGETLDERSRRFLAENRRKYLVRPKDAMSRPKRSWGAPVMFAEPTRAGDTRLAPVLALASTERKKHQRNLQALLAGAGQLSSLRVVLGIGKGYTSLTRAHALREDLARIPAKFRMNLIVTDAPSPASYEPATDDDSVEVAA